MSAHPATLLTAEAAAAPDAVKVWGRRAYVVGVLGLVGCGAGWVADREALVRAWLPAYFVWLGVALGSLALLMLQHMTHGSWGVVVRRPLEAAARTVPLVWLGMIPLVLGRASLYPWSRPADVAASHMLKHQQPWMSAPWAIGRAVIFFSLWSLLAWSLNRLSAKQDRDADPMIPLNFQRISGPGLLLYALTVSFLGFDWVMSVNTGWYSSIFGFYFMASQGLAAFAFTILILWLLAGAGALPNVYQPRHLHDVGKLLLAFVLLWAYLSVSQFLIIWSGNLPEEISWYFVRMGPVWKGLSLFVVLFHFVLPFALLLSADLKKDVKRLGPVAALLLLMRWVDLFWQVAPALTPGRFSVHLLHLAAFAGIGGVWTGFFLWQLRRRPLVPLHDPTLAEALTQHG